jgi:NitT/TauT family transport system ATP-binding protein
LEEALTVSDTVYLLSQGPRARVLASYAVTIPRPRNILASRRHPDFAPLLERLWQDMSEAMS